MARHTLTFETQQNVLRVGADLTTGWKKFEKGYRYVGMGRIEFRGDRELVAKVEVRPSRECRSCEVFPENLTSMTAGSRSLFYELKGGSLELVIDLKANLTDSTGNLVLLPQSQKPGYFWRDAAPIRDGRHRFYPTMLLYLNWPAKPKVTTWEYDVLPFLSGGLPELGKRR